MNLTPAGTSEDRVLQRYRVHAARPLPFVLENASQAAGWRTRIGSDPFAVLWAKGERIRSWIEGEYEETSGDPLERLARTLDHIRDHDPDPDKVLAVGMFGYELNRHVERLPQTARDDQNFPDLVVGFYDRVDVDSSDGFRTIEAGGERERAWNGWTCPDDGLDELPASLDRSLTREEYLHAIGRAREAIRAGDIYQVNLSQRFSGRTPDDPLAIYERLRAASPAPYAALIDMGSRAVVSSSPELFLRVENGHVVTRPIKGTRPRGRSSEEDQYLYRQLVQSEKDQAELVMIVDLERNDLGRVCEPGTVVVTHPREIEAHPTVWHSVATVKGRLRSDVGPIELLRATFPCGSITGAPKIRAMQIIDEIEPTTRGAFTGAIGWIEPGGNMCLNVAIRTVMVHGSWCTLQAGGGIVWDSVAEQEYQESLDKARAMAHACGVELD